MTAILTLTLKSATFQQVSPVWVMNAIFRDFCKDYVAGILL